MRADSDITHKAKYREAVIQFLNATQIDSGFAAAHYQLAQSYIKLQDWQHAYQEIGRTLELQPDNYKAHADMANMLAADYASTDNPSDITTPKSTPICCFKSSRMIPTLTSQWQIC